MQVAFTVLELDNMAENAHHEIAGLFFFVDLVRDQLYKLFLLGAQPQGIRPPPNRLRLKRTPDIVRCSQLVSPFHADRAVFRPNHDNRHLFAPAVLFHGRQHLEAVHFRCHDVQQHQIDTCLHILQGSHRLQSVLRLNNSVFFLQHGGQNEAVHL